MKRPAGFRLVLLPLAMFLTACQSQTATPPAAPASNAGSKTGTTTSAQENSSGPAPEDAPAEPPAQPVTQAPEILTGDELRDGWIALFDGHSLFGWQAANKANWRVEEGAIVVDEGEVGLLCTNSQFSNYVLKLEFRSAAGTNSGVFLHTPRQPQDPATDCYELNIADSDNPFPTGSLVKRIKAEGNFDSQHWQSYQVTVNHDQITILLDGQEVLSYHDPRPLHRGHIGLQLNSGKVEFRNIKLQPLGGSNIFNGQDLTGWKTHPGVEPSVTEEGALNLQGGSGMIESRDSYGDFVLQLECKLEASNSGVFFRCIPGEKMMGYESQIHNGFKDSDRRQPVDCGTGGLFRRQEARLVVANDQEWFHKTIIADGPHLATWVNGYQVTDWTDTRTPDPNPRRGLRLEPGTIMFQGHDPATDVSFRNLRISGLLPRAK